MPAPHATAVMPSARAAITLASKLHSLPFDTPFLEAMGVALDSPAYLYVVANEPVLEVGIAKRPAVEASFDLAVAKKKAKKLPDTESVDRAIELVTKDARIFVARAGDRLFLAPARAAWPSVAIASAVVATKPAAPPKWIGAVEKKLIAHFSARGVEGAERIEGAVFGEGNTIDLRVNAMLDFASGLLLADLSQPPGKSKTLITEKSSVLDATAYFPASAVTNLFELNGVSAMHAKNASGRVHFSLAKSGALIVALEAREGASNAEAEALRTAVAAQLDGVDVRLGRATGDDRAPFEVRARPKELVAGLEARSKTKSSVRLLRPEVAVVRSRLGGVLERLDDARAEVAVTPGALEVRATVQLAR